MKKHKLRLATEADAQVRHPEDPFDFCSVIEEALRFNTAMSFPAPGIVINDASLVVNCDLPQSETLDMILDSWQFHCIGQASKDQDLRFRNLIGVTHTHVCAGEEPWITASNWPGFRFFEGKRHIFHRTYYINSWSPGDELEYAQKHAQRIGEEVLDIAKDNLRLDLHQLTMQMANQDQIQIKRTQGESPSDFLRRAAAAFEGVSADELRGLQVHGSGTEKFFY